MEDAAEARDEESVVYTLAESFKPNPGINFDDTLGMIRATRAQILSRSSILNDPERPPGHSLAWDEWERHTRRSLAYFERRLIALNEALARGVPLRGLDLIRKPNCPCGSVRYPEGMRNLFSLTKGQAAIIALTRAMRDATGNLLSMPGFGQHALNVPTFVLPAQQRRLLGWEKEGDNSDQPHPRPPSG